MSFVTIETETLIPSRVSELQSVFGTKGKNLSYDPAPERWWWERMLEGRDFSEAFERFTVYQIEEIKTAMRERYNVSESPIDYVLNQDGEVINSLLPDEPFTTILSRGIEYRKRNGSREQERESSELEGYIKVCSKLFNPDTCVGAKVVVISPPGLVENSPYSHNFVDIYEKKNKTTVKMTRFTSGTDYDGYINLLEKKFPGYFDGIQDETVDAWLLSHPIVLGGLQAKKSSEEIFEQLFEIAEGTTTLEEFQEIFNCCFPLILNFINLLTQDQIEPRKLRIAFRAIFNKADKRRDLIRNGGSGNQEMPLFDSLQKEVNSFGKIPMVSVPSGCGLSGDFGEDIAWNTSGSSSQSYNFLLNSVAQFAEFDDYGPLRFPCPLGHWNTRERNRLRESCSTCGCDVSCKH